MSSISTLSCKWTWFSGVWNITISGATFSEYTGVRLILSTWKWPCLKSITESLQSDAYSLISLNSNILKLFSLHIDFYWSITFDVFGYIFGSNSWLLFVFVMSLSKILICSLILWLISISLLEFSYLSDVSHSSTKKDWSSISFNLSIPKFLLISSLTKEIFCVC